MQFLDDYIELLDNVPAEVRERFEEMRKLDDLNNHALIEYERKCNEYVTLSRQRTSSERAEAKKLLDEMLKTIRHRSSQKLLMADQMFDMMKKYEERLAKESMLYKYELEADNPGITEQIESKFNQTVRSYKPIRGEKKKRGRKPGSGNRTNVLTGSNGPVHENGNHIAQILLGDLTNGHSSSMENGKNGKDENLPRRKPISPGMTIASIQRQSRERSHSRSRGSRASTPGTKMNPLVNGVNTAASSLLMNASESRHGRPRKLTSRAQEMIINRLENRVGRPPGSGASAHRTAEQQPTVHHGPPEPMRTDDREDDSDLRTWCVCNEKSYGEMVACDGKSCPYEWFHYQCVNVTEPPKGAWLCPHCRQQAAVGNAFSHSESSTAQDQTKL
uniref:Inhibitor of growth protein n=1 Tax=Steinernema glaseri TaxID=37863 RepID=A0A1I8AAA1_9BILA